MSRKQYDASEKTRASLSLSRCFGSLLNDDLRDLFILGINRVHAELAVGTSHVLRCRAASYTAEDDTIKERIASKAIVSMHAASSFAIHCSLKTSHAVMDHWRNNGDIESLALYCRPRDDVMEELFATSSLAAWLIPSLSTWICWE